MRHTAFHIYGNSYDLAQTLNCYHLLSLWWPLNRWSVQFQWTRHPLIKTGTLISTNRHPCSFQPGGKGLNEPTPIGSLSELWLLYIGSLGGKPALLRPGCHCSVARDRASLSRVVKPTLFTMERLLKPPKRLEMGSCLGCCRTVICYQCTGVLGSYGSLMEGEKFRPSTLGHLAAPTTRTGCS